MRIFCTSSLKGWDIAKPLYIAVALWLVFLLTAQSFFSLAKEVGIIFIFDVFLFVGFICVLIAFVYIFFYFIKTIICSFAVGEYELNFTGKFQEFLKKILIGGILTSITLGIYYPWFKKCMMDYWASGTTVGGHPIKFTGTVSRLWKYYFFAGILPFIIVFLFFFFSFNSFVTESSLSEEQYLYFFVIFWIYFIFVINIVCIPFFCLILKWKMFFSWPGKDGEPDVNSVLEISLLKAVFYFLGQFLLGFISCGILIPLLILNMYRYFVSRIKLYPGESKISMGTFGTNLRLGEGFLFLYFLMFLSFITFGLYLPWAYAAAIRFFSAKTWIDYDDTKKIMDGPRLLLENKGEAPSQ